MVLPAYRARILPEWIDYNGHLRDAYYTVVLSHAIDEVMDHLGLDAAYRARTSCTLYTLELHMHFLHEVKESDELSVATSVLDFDRKRIHAGCEFSCPAHHGCGRDRRRDAAARASGRQACERRLPAGSRAAARRPEAHPGGARGVGARIAQNRIEAPVSSMPAFDIQRLIAPRTIALIGAGVWTDAVAAGNAAVGFGGTIWRVHPSRPSTTATTYYRSVAELPGPPDAAFLAVPNHEAPAVAGELAARGAGGFVCFSSGFSELGTESGRQLTQALLDRAGRLPFFGPNCYGFVNFFDRAALLPDQVVGAHVERGVAFICQSGTIALTLSFNERSVPIGYLFSVGNQTRLAVEDLIEILCEDPRVTAFGLYLEGIKDADRFARAADIARAGGQAHRSRQVRPHRRGGANGAQPYGRPRGRRLRIRGILPPGRPRPLRYAGHAVRDRQDISHGRRPPRP